MAALLGCGPKEVMSTDLRPKDKFAGITGQPKVDAIRNDPTIPTPLRHQMIADAQRAAGMPVTGQ